jgi:predicted site-specific integrase-resolvase
MKLADWARQQGISYKTAFRLFQTGKLPCRSEQYATGTIIVHPDAPKVQAVAIYGRVSSGDQKEDLARQVQRLRDYCAAQGWSIAKEVTDIGSGLNDGRKGLLRLLADKTVTTIVVEHRDRLMRFGTEMVVAALQAEGRKLETVNASEFKDDMVQDFVDVVTSMCARIYGKRAAKNRAARAIKAAAEDIES